MNLSSDHWTAWFDRHSAALILFAQQIVGQRSDAEDAVQEGFVRFWRNRQQAEDSIAYLYTCVKRCALDQVRGSQRRRQREQRASNARGQVYFVDTGQTEQQRRTVEQALQILPEDQRQVVVLKVWGELTYAQIASALDISPNTAASRFRYALRRMRDQMDEAAIP